MAEVDMALWVSCETQLVHGNPTVDEEPFDVLVAELIEFSSSQEFPYRPARICVTDKFLAEQLGELLQSSGTSVSWDAKPDFWCHIQADMAEHMLESVTAPCLADTKCTSSQIRAFAEAAAAFFRARPWQYLDDTDLLQIQTPKPLKHLKYLTVMGAGRREFGIGFYETVATHWDMRAQRLDLNSLELFSLTFNPISEAIERDVAHWNEHDLPLETGDAFPQFLFYSPEGARSPEPKELEFVTIVLAALAQTTEDEIDSGQWSKQVCILGKNKRCKISIPDLLNPPDRKEWLDRGMIPERRGNERHLGLVQAFMEQNQGLELDQLNELINSKFTGSIDDFDYPSKTPFDRAENLCYTAIDTYGRRRVQLARQALQEDPSHIEANLLLAESTFDTNRKIVLFSTAVQNGEARCADLMKTEVGHFWDISETRPFLRAKYGLAFALAFNGQVNEAIVQFRDILRLNQNDNLGVRYEIIPLLLSQDKEQEAVEILNQYSEETGSWLFLKAQVEFRREGPSGRSAQRAFRRASNFNPHVVELLMAEHLPTMPEHYALGSPEEAAVIIEEQLDSWTESEGFIEWMIQQAAIIEREKSKKERDRKRKLQAKKRKARKSRRK